MMRNAANVAISEETAGTGDQARSGAGAILLAALDTLDGAGIAWCIPHGFEHLPWKIGADVDCIVDRQATPARLLALFRKYRDRIGAEVVRVRGMSFEFAGRDRNGALHVLALDLSHDYEVNGLPLRSGAEILASRRQRGRIWVPAPAIAFGSALARAVGKRRFDTPLTRRLDDLFSEDAEGAERLIRREWSPGSAGIILLAARSRDWVEVERRLGRLRGELVRRAIVGHPTQLLAGKVRAVSGRLRQLWRPEGVSLVVLGPDGAGKSSVVDALAPALAAAFPRATVYGFSPMLVQRLLHGRNRSTSTPHALPVRSPAASVARAALYWFPYHTLGYPVRHWQRLRSGLVLNDRHFVDLLVDPRRYRYGGPKGLLRLLWRGVPKPDLVVLLDAPPEVLQARKQEVPFEETARQRNAYLSLVRSLENGRVVDATQPFARVVAEVSDLAIRHVAARTAGRYRQGGALESGAAQPITS